MEIFKPTLNFDFNKITLGNPQPIQGGSFFSKITFSPEEKDLYIQLPKCITKQAIIGTKRGKYCDLMYTRDHNETFFNWLEKLETVFHDLIDKKKNLWFTGEYTKDDIENMMAPITRIYKSGAYTLLRTYIHTNKHTGEDKCSAYNESEISIDINSIVPENDIIPLILIDGVKFTSKSFELDIKLTQLMVLSESINLNKKCLIQVSNKIKESTPQPLDFEMPMNIHLAAEPTVIAAEPTVVAAEPSVAAAEPSVVASVVANANANANANTDANIITKKYNFFNYIFIYLKKWVNVFWQ